MSAVSVGFAKYTLVHSEGIFFLENEHLRCFINSKNYTIIKNQGENKSPVITSSKVLFLKL